MLWKVPAFILVDDADDENEAVEVAENLMYALNLYTLNVSATGTVKGIEIPTDVLEGRRKLYPEE